MIAKATTTSAVQKQDMEAMSTIVLIAVDFDEVWYSIKGGEVGSPVGVTVAMRDIIEEVITGWT